MRLKPFNLLMLICAAASFNGCAPHSALTVLCPGIIPYSPADQVVAVIELAAAKEEKYVMLPRMMDDYHKMRAEARACGNK